MRRALEIFARSLGRAHPNTNTVRQNFAALLAESGVPENDAGQQADDVIRSEEIGN